MHILTEKRKSSKIPLSTEVPDDFETFTSVLSEINGANLLETSTTDIVNVYHVGYFDYVVLSIIVSSPSRF